MEIDLIKDRVHLFGRSFLALKLKGEGDVLPDREIGEDVVFLEDEAKVGIAVTIEFGLGEILARFPMITMSPESIRSRPPTTLRRVDLPAPDLPKIKTRPFSPKVRLTWSRALTSGPFFTR
jgi:hypothetical protein